MSEDKLMASPHAAEAKVLLEKIRALRAEIPRFTPDDLTAPQRLNARASYPNSILESAAVALDKSPRLRAAVGIAAIVLRDALGFAIAYGPCVRELLSLAKLMAHAIRVQRAKATAIALDTYSIARRMSTQEGGAELLPFVEDVSLTLKARRARRTKPAAAAPERD